MRRIYDFKCPDAHVTEHLVEADVTRLRCECGKEALRIISPVKCQLEGASGDFPGAHFKWVREHESAGAKAKS